LSGDWLSVAAQNIDWAPFMRMTQYLGAGLAMGLGAIGAGVGEGYNAAATVDAISRQPSAAGDLTRVMLVGQAVAETSGIFALVMAFVLIFLTPVPCAEAMGAFLGAGLAMGLGAVGSGVGAGVAGARAAAGIGRNPRTRGHVTIMMLLGQGLASSPAVFALVIAVVLAFAQQFQKYVGNDPVAAVSAMSAGLCIGAGAIGPGFGAGVAAGGACEGTARRPEANNQLMRVMLVGGAVSQSTCIYAFVIAFILIFFI